MNSSSSNSNNGFSSFNEANPILGFSSPPLTAARKPGAATSSASTRFLKVRNQASFHNHKSTNPLGFNQFTSSSEAVLGNLSFENDPKETFLFGANNSNSSSHWNLERGVSSEISNVILDDMLKMKIDSDKGYANPTQDKADVDKSSVDELPNEVSKLKIHDSTNESQFIDFVQSEKMGEFAFTSKLDDIGAPQVEFRTPDMRSNLFSGMNRFEAKKDSVKDTRSKKKKDKSKNSIVGHSRLQEDYGFTRRNPSENPDGFEFEAYLPLNIRPYDEKLADLSRLSGIKGQEVDLSNFLSKKGADLKPVNEQAFTSSSSKIAEDACEKWRLRGNQAYNNGELVKAEDCYTQGLNSVSENEKSRSCLKALMLCYSNRSATRVSLGKMKEALQDCLMASTIDPNFLKVQLRAAHCYLAIGETENAKQQYTKCMQQPGNDKKVIAEASEGLEKAQKVSECIKQCNDLSQRQDSRDLESAMRFMNEALQISTCSDKLLQMKADTLFMLQRYEEVIQTCEQITSDEASNLIVKSYFYLGKLDDALEFIKKQENSSCIIPLSDTIRELLSYKKAGNEAYKSGKHTEAIEHYTAALSHSVESRSFASVCFCNRSAAYRGLGQITDAIADCSLAIALDPNYLKAISRRASLHEMIRDYGQVAIDLERLVSLLTTRVDEKGVNEIKQTRIWLSNVEEESRKGIPLNMYLILGTESNANASDIKKAYRKAALRHHPDKAAQSVVRSDDGDDGLWKEIAENVHKDVDRLFKMIGEAYAVLSNPLKRSQYDQDEEMRNEGRSFSRSKSSRMGTDVQNAVFTRTGSHH
ncbi:uncharacterized protein LOC111903822 [Lactuca sativa]|uniref:J domain-containing protein n=1 Tax=Lactuca sativa TaxID=4236 RepID=A0A9R1V9A8_LACSA|nr:uncharacterized protein LOC111903822 [Lactuca sativa]KAJ0202055.1 hypothetical protein LSAT_V11C600308360 [Lactuca sativa]